MTNQRVSSFQFDDFRVEPRNFKLFKAEADLPLEPKTFLLLVFLLENRDRLVEKSEILDAVWKDIAVTENALTREVGKLRKSLGDDPKAAKYIQTVHTRGYRFIADVRILDGSPETLASSSSDPPDAKDQEPAGPGSRFSKWLPYKVFVAVSAIVLFVASTLLLRQPAAGVKPVAAKREATKLAVLPF